VLVFGKPFYSDLMSEAGAYLSGAPLMSFVPGYALGLTRKRETMKTSSYKGVNRTETFLSVRIPCNDLTRLDPTNPSLSMLQVSRSCWPT